MPNGSDHVRAKRLANVRTVEAARRFELEEILLLCECSSVECVERIAIEPDAFEGLQAQDAYLVAPGHSVE